MISVYFECTPGEQDLLIAELHERGTSGVLELDTGVRAWFDEGVEIGDLVARYDGEILAEDEADWVRRTEDSFPPLEIGERLWLAPPWNRDPVPTGRLRLEINPGLACGTGWHECTQMCLEALERYAPAGGSVLDVGTGSGILMAAADLLGARRAVGCDIDADAVRVARERVGNRVFAGTVDAVRDRSFDVVVANISAAEVIALAGEFRRVCRRPGILILSGFTSVPRIEGVIETLARVEWRAIVVRV